MKRFVTTCSLALAIGVFAPQVHADCGSCGSGDKAHTHEAGDAHEHEKCAGCDEAKSNCACEKKDGTACECGKAGDDCECKKE